MGSGIRVLTLGVASMIFGIAGRADEVGRVRIDQRPGIIKYPLVYPHFDRIVCPAHDGQIDLSLPGVSVDDGA
jgi:hypothetical protein